MKLTARVVFVVVSLLVLPTSALAQTRGVLAPGSQLRIEAPGYTPGRVGGTVQAYTHEGLFLLDAGSTQVYLIPSTRDIRYLAHFKGRDRGYAAKKLALPSAFILGAVGVVGGPLLAIVRDDEHGMLRTSAIAGGFGVLVGGAGGGILGARRAGEVWKVYRLPPVAGPRTPAAGLAVEREVDDP